MGTGFWEAGERSAIIGGGLGIPPLLELSKRIPGEAEVFLGYADAPFMDGDFRGHGRKVHVASQTGNGGFCGTVLELVEDIAPLADRVYACGPRQMLQAVAEWAERQGIPAQVCLLGILRQLIPARSASASWGQTAVQPGIFDC